MRYIFSLAIFLGLSAASAQDHWSAADLDTLTRELTGEAAENNSAVRDRIIDHGSYFAAMVYREPGPGFSESHSDWADVYFVSSGTATLITGGTIPNGRETAPGELRGSEISGGVRRTITRGDVVHIPAGMPHHVIVEPGNEIAYFILKIEATAR
jgi:mannose-6-phosphate isomerase-like protein (cupin superfamily)